MDTEDFLTQIEAEQMAPPQPETRTVTVTSYGLQVSQMPHRDALLGIKHLLEPEQGANPEAKPLLFRVEGDTARQIGLMYLTIDKFARLQRILSLYTYQLVEVDDSGNWGNDVPKERLISTITLKGSSIFTHI